MTNVFYLILRRMRFPLILIVVIYAICVTGLSLMPGVDADGNPTPGLDLFTSFYVISYTGTTIGFGEIPSAYSTAQRLWMTLSIYATVVGWSYSIVSVFALVQERNFLHTMRAGRFARQIQHMRHPFYIVCGLGETGVMVCHGLDRLGLRFVVIERDDQRLQEFKLEEFHQDPPAIVADAHNPHTLAEAGLFSPVCKGVMALAPDDETNRAIAVTTRLLAPDVPVLARVRNPDFETHLGAFGGETVINPFARFSEHLVSALTTPERHQLRNMLTGFPGQPLPERHHPPRGHWIMCGYGRFGHAVVQRLRKAGIDISVVDDGPHQGIDVRGSGTESSNLIAAGIENATGIVVGNDDDMENLAIVVTAQDLQPGIFIVVRQNNRVNAKLFEALSNDYCMVPSELVAQEFLALITTPMLSRFLERVQYRSESWCAKLMGLLSELDHGVIPDVWSVAINPETTGGIQQSLAQGKNVDLNTALKDPIDRMRRLDAMVLLVMRADESYELPGYDFELQENDELLLAGTTQAKHMLEISWCNVNMFNYVLSGSEGNGGWLWQWFAKQRQARRVALVPGVEPAPDDRALSNAARVQFDDQPDQAQPGTSPGDLQPDPSEGPRIQHDVAPQG